MGIPGSTAHGAMKVGRQVFLVGLLAVGLLGCVAMPGGTLDPLVPALGLPPATQRPPPQPRTEPPAPAGATAPRQDQSPARYKVQPPDSPSAQSEWIGRYRDSRGEGEIALVVLRDGEAVGGTWRLRTGGSGTFTGIVAPDDRTLSFSMRGSDRECPVILGGIAEYVEDRIRGTYQGTDCHGAVGDGRLDLRKR